MGRDCLDLTKAYVMNEVMKRSTLQTLHLAFQEVRSSVLADSGGDPIWDCEGKVTVCRAVPYSSCKVF